jgi:hypothetical protein
MDLKLLNLAKVATVIVFFEPTVRFFGSEFDLIRAFEICIINKFEVYEAKRVYRKVPLYDEKELKVKGLSWDKPFNELIFKNIE